MVGSPHYVAPEVLQDSDAGYDRTEPTCGRQALFSMLLAGNLPFGKDLLNCPRLKSLVFERRRSRTAVRVVSKLAVPMCQRAIWNKMSSQSSYWISRVVLAFFFGSKALITDHEPEPPVYQTAWPVSLMGGR